MIAGISRLLKPAIPEADSSEEHTAKSYKYWIWTSETFLSTAQSGLLLLVHEDDDEGDELTTQYWIN